MQNYPLNKARHQAKICNACRFCESNCWVFPELHHKRAFLDCELTQRAILCHNCRGFYYACQYTAQHESDSNLSKALAAVEQESWKDHAQLMNRSGVLMSAGLMLVFAIIFALAQAMQAETGDGF